MYLHLHYLVKLEMLIGHVLPLSRCRKKTPEFISSQLWPPNSPDLNPVDYRVWGLLQEKVYKTRITDLDELKQRLRTDWAKLDHIAIAGSHLSVSCVVDKSRSVMRVLYTFFCNISHMLLSTGFNYCCCYFSSE